MAQALKRLSPARESGGITETCPLVGTRSRSTTSPARSSCRCIATARSRSRLAQAFVQIRRRFINVANTLLNDGGIPAARAASRIVREHFPPIEKVADVSDAQRIEDLSDVPDAPREERRAIQDAARQKNEETPVTPWRDNSPECHAAPTCHAAGA